MGCRRSKRTFKSKLEIFQTSRPVRSMPAGMTLRVVDTERFRVVYSSGRLGDAGDAGVEAGGVCGVVRGYRDRSGAGGED